MNITFSIDEKVAKEARKVAENMGTSLNQLIRNHLELLSKKNQLSSDFEEFVHLSGQGHKKS
jgi:antitoxin component of RelBE/YafQ-DinJ toxin-antitoxin module